VGLGAGRFQDETAAESCGNPAWHEPTWKLPEALEPRDYVDVLAKAMKSA
jgi:hypothetical protein